MASIHFFYKFKKWFLLGGALLLVSLIAVFMFLRPMSVNYLNYWIWKANNGQSEKGFINYRSARIYYTVYGQGDPVLLLHGGLANQQSWFSQLPWLVESGRRVVLIDTRGHGESTHGDLELNYQLFAEDSVQVLDKLGIPCTNIIGWSDGGITALLMGVEAPERVHRIVAISANYNTSGLLNNAGQPEGENYLNFQVSVINWFRNVWSDPASESHQALEKELNNMWRTEPHLTRSELQAIVAPTLVIAGENDIIDLSHSGELAEMLTYGKLEIIQGSGHATPVTHANQINELIASFLGIAAT